MLQEMLITAEQQYCRITSEAQRSSEKEKNVLDVSKNMSRALDEKTKGPVF